MSFLPRQNDHGNETKKKTIWKQLIFAKPEVLKLPVLPVLSVMGTSGPTLDVF